MNAALVGTPLVVKAQTNKVAARRSLQVVASSAGPKKGTAAAPPQAAVGYKGSTIAGSAPGKAGKPGYVYKLGLKNGKANVDEYSPIYNPNDWKFDGDTYEPGIPGLAAWAATLGAILLGGAYAVYATSAL